MLVALLTALSLWPTDSRADESPEAWRTLRILAPGDAPYIDWSLVEDWPRSLIATWRLEALNVNTLKLADCRADALGARDVHHAEIRQVETAAAAINARIRGDLTACEASQDTGLWWQVPLAVVGGVVAVVLAGYVGAEGAGRGWW